MPLNEQTGPGMKPVVKQTSRTSQQRTTVPQHTGPHPGPSPEDQLPATHQLQHWQDPVTRDDEDIAALARALTALLGEARGRIQQPFQYQEEVEEAARYGIGTPRSALHYGRMSANTHTQRKQPLARIPLRASRAGVQTQEQEPPAPRPRVPWLLWAGVAILIMLLGYVAVSVLGSWWQTTQDDWHYGRPRTFQIDAVVGHGDSPAHPSHFIVLNLQGRIEVIEFPGADPTHARLYLGPMLLGKGADLAPVTLSFQDVNGDGRPDMLIHVQDSTFVFLNDPGGFHLARPIDSLHLPAGT